MSYDGVRTWIEASIAGLVPQIHVVKSCVAPSRVDEEGGDHVRSSSAITPRMATVATS